MNLFNRLFHKHWWDKTHGDYGDPVPGAKCLIKGCTKVYGKTNDLTNKEW